MIYDKETPPVHGVHDSGQLIQFCLETGEIINKIIVRENGGVEQLTFFTNTSKQHGPFGGSTGDAYTVYMPNGLQFMSGKCDQSLNSVAFHSC